MAITNSNAAYYHYAADDIDELPPAVSVCGATACVEGRLYVAVGAGWMEFVSAVQMAALEKRLAELEADHKKIKDKLNL